MHESYRKPANSAGMFTIDHSIAIRVMKKKTNAELKYIIKDCQEALAANPQTNNASVYADEINYASMELTKRNQTQEQDILANAPDKKALIDLLGKVIDQVDGFELTHNLKVVDEELAQRVYNITNGVVPVIRHKTSTKKVNAAIKEQTGLNVTIHKGGGYYYFCSEDTDTALILAAMESTSVYVCNLNQQSVQQWVNDFKVMWDKHIRRLLRD